MQISNSPARLLIADDHALAREGVRAMLASETELEVIGEAQDGHEVRESVSPPGARSGAHGRADARSERP